MNYDALARSYDTRYKSRQSLAENDQVAKLLNQNISYGDIVADIGCGTAFGLDCMEKMVCYTGYDISEAMLEQASIKHPQANFVYGGLKDLEGPNDAILSLFSLPYIDDGNLDRIPECLDDNGRFIAVYYDKPYLNPDSVYHGKRGLFRRDVMPPLRRAIEALRSLMDVKEEGQIGEGTYRFLVAEKP